MTVHVSGRSISALLLLSVSLVGLPADVESTGMGGRRIFQVERVEVGLEQAPDTFTLGPFAASSEVR